MNHEICISGDTMRCRARFFDWAGSVAYPTNARLRVYDTRYNKLDDIPMLRDNPDDEWCYCDHVIPSPGNYIVEYYAEYGGYPTVKREHIAVKFV